MVNLRLFHIYQFVTWPSVRSPLVLTRCPRASENVTRRGHMRDNPIWYYVNGLGCLWLRGVKKGKIINLLLPKLCAKASSSGQFTLCDVTKGTANPPQYETTSPARCSCCRYNLTSIVRFFLCVLWILQETTSKYTFQSVIFFVVSKTYT